MARPYRRTQYLIATQFQLKFVGIILVFMFIGAFISAFTIYYYTWLLLGEKLANIYPQGRLITILKTSNMILLGRMLLITPMVAILAVLLSHRIAGPLYRIKKTLEEVAAGNYGLRIRLRRTDELQDVAESMNKVIEKLETCSGDSNKNNITFFLTNAIKMLL
jgi:methyl-accepting chemotaxis protein